LKDSKGYKQIALKRETYKRLTNVGSKGQSYDQIVSWLLDLWMERFAENVGKLEKVKTK